MVYTFIVLAFIASLLITLWVRKVALKKSVLDIPNDRSSHSIPTPRGGGLAVAITWFLAITLYWALFSEMQSNLFFALLCGLPVAVFGLIDDIVNLSPKVRLLIQTASAAGALFFLRGFQQADFGLFVIEWPVLLSLVGVVATVWFINLFNFLDGIDGYIGAETIFIAIALYAFTGNWVLLILAAAVAGFLVWNWQPAKIFMGDVGSTLLGFNVAVFSIYFQNSNQLSILSLLMLSSLFWFDATLTLFRRFLNKEDLAKAHRNHAYQRIVQFGFSHQKTTLAAMLINSAILLMVFAGVVNKVFIPIGFIACLLLLFIFVKLIDKRKPFPYTNKH